MTTTPPRVRSLYVGGTEGFTSELASRSLTNCEFVDHNDVLPIED